MARSYKRSGSTRVGVRLPNILLEQLRKLGAKLDVGYQTLIVMYVKERVAYLKEREALEVQAPPGEPTPTPPTPPEEPLNKESPPKSVQEEKLSPPPEEDDDFLEILNAVGGK